LIFAAAVVWAVPAFADIYGYTEVSYDSGADKVNGYSWTYADPWESQWREYCDEWAYDPEYGEEYCVRGHGYNDWLDADASLYTPSGSHAATNRTINWPFAQASYSVTPWEYDGDWVAFGDHYIVEEVYDYDIEWGWSYLGTDWIYLGYTRHQVNVPARCTTPPLLSRHGPRVGAGYAYKLQPSVWEGGEEAGVHNAFANWQAANQSSGLGATFNPVDWGSPAAFSVVRAPLGTDPNGNKIAAGIADVQTDGENFVTSATIIYERDRNYASGEPGLRRLGQHEIGHIHALDDTPGPNRSSVMLTNIQPNDSGNRLAENVTTCDATAAWNAHF
jgi:hypothetical protein